MLLDTALREYIDTFTNFNDRNKRMKILEAFVNTQGKLAQSYFITVNIFTSIGWWIA